MLIQVINGGWLLLVLIGVPWMVSRQFGPWRISSRSHWEELTLWGLAIGLGVNLAVAWWRRSGRRGRKLWLVWAGVYAAVMGLQAFLFSR